MFGSRFSFAGTSDISSNPTPLMYLMFLGWGHFSKRASRAVGLQASILLLSCLCRECPSSVTFSRVCGWNGNESLPCSSILCASEFCAIRVALNYTFHNILDMAVSFCEEFG